MANTDTDPDEEQGQLEGTNLAAVKFQGMAWETGSPPNLGDIVEFSGKGQVVALGEEIRGDDSQRTVAKVKVTDISLG